VNKDGKSAAEFEKRHILDLVYSNLVLTGLNLCVATDSPSTLSLKGYLSRKAERGDSLTTLPRHPTFCDKHFIIWSYRKFQLLSVPITSLPDIDAHATKPPQDFCWQ
jgi:hypothetical protein